MKEILPVPVQKDIRELLPVRKKKSNIIKICMKERKEKMKIERITAILCIAITVTFVWSLVSEASDYREGVRLVALGEYEKAGEIFTELEGYRDSEVLCEYCKVMAEYDASDYASVVRCYHALKAVNVDNEALEVETARAMSEIHAIYVYVGGVMYG